VITNMLQDTPRHSFSLLINQQMRTVRAASLPDLG